MSAAGYELHGGALRGGKVTRLRRALMEELATSGHVHYLSREGAWCVTGTQIGPLWELLPKLRGVPIRDRKPPERS